MYNKTTKLCTLYKGFSAYSEPPKSVLGDVYVADACEAYLDFRVSALYNGLLDMARVSAVNNGLLDIARVSALYNGLLDMTWESAYYNGLLDMTWVISQYKGLLGITWVTANYNGLLDMSRHHVTTILIHSQKPIVQLFIPSTIFVAYIYQALSYQDALATCGCLQSTMFTVKTMDRYTFLIAQEGLKYYEWVGLDDIKTEGTFLWADDGKKFTDLALEKLLFDFGQPDNGHNIVDEDCVIKKRLEDITAGKLNDVSCNLTAFFICEKVNC
ncbi:collectin-10 [Biomphalaria glabrata]